jgi:hypothetical protein
MAAGSLRGGASRNASLVYFPSPVKLYNAEMFHIVNHRVIRKYSLSNKVVYSFG